ncbi:hypothetical protein SXIM_31360 [Streptomyces xiamenensis]|uniref:Uncharacterized protein n=1 Tax=Streptomyces xiamenensis TaxID=408015 RepID=A0A0F7FVF2_9ACTN|nr:hypothetical protein SXIM_31360 [Streptomyces xiamenensis]
MSGGVNRLLLGHGWWPPAYRRRRCARVHVRPWTRCTGCGPHPATAGAAAQKGLPFRQTPRPPRRAGRAAGAG